jgi:aspartyl-tRNA(Asn)/glutamyl-tRNA(Gln) amidotransferase subunit B
VAKILNDREAIKLASNYITSDYIGLKKINPEVKLTKPENFAELIKMAKGGHISSRATKDILGRIVINDESPEKIAKENNLLQSNDEGALKTIVEKIILENPEVVAVYKGGKENAIMSLVGKIIKESNGSANPQIVIKLLKEILARP